MGKPIQRQCCLSVPSCFAPRGHCEVRSVGTLRCSDDSTDQDTASGESARLLVCSSSLPWGGALPNCQRTRSRAAKKKQETPPGKEWAILYQKFPGGRQRPYVNRTWKTKKEALFELADLLRHFRADNPWRQHLSIGPWKPMPPGTLKKITRNRT